MTSYRNIVHCNSQQNHKLISIDNQPADKMSKPASGITLERTLKWLDKTEGRDKFCKAIQYACRFLKHEYKEKGNKQMEKKVDALFCAMRDARKLFRLFKSLKEYGKLLELLSKRGSMKEQEFILNVINRFFFMLYWFFDNVSILSKLGILNQDAKSFAKKGATCWFIALVASLVLCLKNIITNWLKISALKKATYSTNTGETNEKLSRITEIKNSNRKQLLTLVKTVGDMLPAGQGAEFYQKVFGKSVSEKWCGLGGLASALITSYELYG